MKLTLNIRGFSTVIVPDQEYADAVCTPSKCPFYLAASEPDAIVSYDGECWALNMGRHPEERSVGNPPPYGCEAVESYDVDGKMGQYTVAAPDPGDVSKIGTASEAKHG